MGNFPNVRINKFTGLTKSTDVLSALPGQLIKNHNYLYMSNGGLYERGGGDKLSDNPSGGSDPLFSLANYNTPNGSNRLITNQDTTAYYYNAGWQDLSLSLTADQKVRWEGAGFESNRALYGVNGVDSVIKVIGNTPVGSAVANSPTDLIDLKLHKNRLFGINNGDTLSFTEVLDFDTWDTVTNTIEIAPGIDGNCQALEVWGDALFIFKEYGVYILPNADSPDPSLNWVILRSDAKSGTQSTDSVSRTKTGIFYLSSDNYIRSIGPSVSFSSGEYSLGESGSPIVSEDIQDDLINLLDVSSRNNAQSIGHNDLYILSFQSVNNSDNYNDLTYFADVTKANQLPGVVQLQPYWGEFTGFDYDFFATQTSGNQTLLYGAKGDTGVVQETLNDSIHNDAGGAISSKAILGWLAIGGSGTIKRFRQVYFAGDTENWNIALTFNAYVLGNPLPGESEGVSFDYTTGMTNAGKVGTALVGTALVGNAGAGSSKYNFRLKGHYFIAEFGNANADEFTRIYNLTIYFRNIKQS